MKIEIYKAIEKIFSQMEDETLDASYGEWHLCGTEKAKQSLAALIHQAEITARIDELVKLKKAHSIAIFDEYLENHISALEKEIV